MPGLTGSLSIHNSSQLGPSMQSSLLPEWLQGYVGFLPSRRGPGKGQKGPQLLLQASTLEVALPYPSLDPQLVLVGGESQWRLRPGPPSGWHLALSLWALESWLGASLLCRKNTGLWEYKSSTLSCQCPNTPQKYLVLIFLFICVCLCTMTHTWKSEDNLLEVYSLSTMLGWDCQVYGQGPLPTQPPHQSHSYI